MNACNCPGSTSASWLGSCVGWITCTVGVASRCVSSTTRLCSFLRRASANPPATSSSKNNIATHNSARDFGCCSLAPVSVRRLSSMVSIMLLACQPPLVLLAVHHAEYDWHEEQRRHRRKQQSTDHCPTQRRV